MEEVLQNAKETGTIRRPSVDGVLKILAPDSNHRLTARQVPFSVLLLLLLSLYFSPPLSLVFVLL